MSMSGLFLKLFALVTMTIDHVGLMFFPQYPQLRMIGRLAFPIYCFLLCEGFHHTRSMRKYALRLAVFAAVSFVPYALFTVNTFSIWRGFENIFFELLLGLLALYFADKAIKSTGWERLYLLIPVGTLMVAQGLKLSYGAYGIAMILCFYLFRDKRLPMAISVTLATLFYCWYFHNWIQLYAAYALIPILLYNGNRGKYSLKYLFYAYYPAHMLVLAGVYALLLSA